MEVLRCATDPRWVEVALGDLDSTLIDHAHCEKKAAASAMALVASYPDHTELVRRMSKLAQEELRHFYQVHEIIAARGLHLGSDPGDPYARALLKHVRSDTKENRRLDRLLAFSLIEARSCERLKLLGEALEDDELAHFYRGLSTAEAGHYRLFVGLAGRYALENDVTTRLAQLARIEGDIVTSLPLVARIH